MAILRPKEARSLGKSELEDRMQQLNAELRKEKGAVASGTRAENPGRIKGIKRAIARILTILREREVQKEMSDICPTCGLPMDICVCQQITKEGTKIKISTERKKFKKFMTIVEGFDPDADIKSMGKDFKRKLACGGTVKKNRIELQGDHKNKVKEMLLQMGYDGDQIDIY